MVRKEVHKRTYLRLRISTSLVRSFVNGNRIATFLGNVVWHCGRVAQVSDPHNIYIYIYIYIYIHEGWNFNSGNYLFTTDVK